MFEKRKKFVQEATPESRLSDRWNQQVFYVTRKYPQSKNRIAAIMKSQSRRGSEFTPSEEALTKLADLYSELQGL